MEATSDDEASLLQLPTRTSSTSLLTVVFLGITFMIIFSAFNTHSNMSQVVIESIKKDDPSFTGSGYISLAVIYGFFAGANWLAPSVLSILGPKCTMIVGAVTYFIFIGSFLLPETWLLYSVSILVGFGAAILWTAQGNYLTLVSNDDTIARNSGIFWAVLQCSFLFGNLFVFFAFQGEAVISYKTRVLVYSILTGIAGVGILLMCCLPRPQPREHNSEENSPILAFKKACRLLNTRDMLLLSVAFFYTGVELSFFSGVYSVCISFTLSFSDPKRLVGLSGIFIGCGEIIGGALFGIFGKKTIKWGRDPIIILGFVVHVVSFFFIFINLPSSSPLGNTLEPSYLPNGTPSESLALLCSFLLGFGDACFNTQFYSILGSVYADESGPAFAIFKFTQSLAAAACFFYASVVNLNWHLVILLISGTLGTLSFCIVEWSEKRRKLASLLVQEGD